MNTCIDEIQPADPPVVADLDLATRFGQHLADLYRDAKGGSLVWGRDPFEGGWEHCPVERDQVAGAVIRLVEQSGDEPINAYFRYALFGGDSPSGQAAESMGVPAIVADFDGGDWTVERVLAALACPPSFIIETSPGSYQAHLVFDEPVDVVRARHFVQSWVKQWELVDHASRNLVQAWRLPGSINHGNPAKKEKRPGAYPFVTRLAWEPADGEWGWAPVDSLIEAWGDAPPLDMDEGWQPENDEASSVPANEDSAHTLKRLKALLEVGAFDAPDNRAGWIAMASGLKAVGGDAAREFFHAWSATSVKYGEPDVEDEVWDSLKPDGTKGVGEFFKQSIANGHGIASHGVVVTPEFRRSGEAMITKWKDDQANSNAAMSQVGGNGWGWLDASTPLAPNLSSSWLVKGVLPTQGLAVIYGRPGSGKSFVTLDLG